MQTHLLLIACGLAGALIYSFPAYLRAIAKKPPVENALLTLSFSLFVGGIAALIFTEMVGAKYPWTTDPRPWPLALVIGLCSNPLVPLISRRVENWAENFGGK